ncbi:MAG: asparagine--tRNA ligase [Phycisphaeraceae bacterium]|nr:asparagine--tRNA ligase [Phycisphaerae bacterium]MBX3393503.1 asparagine--tRNA ligase [Phycisphaeraceae bacterium]HRJ49914.1 asparagine--tRNA ligase [Phycisphaerales bacterium]
MSWITVKSAFASPVGTPVTLKGWVRTNRESKADGGLCFLAVSDGTCFDPIQCVIKGGGPGAVGNFDQVQRLTTGCSVEVDGSVVASQGKGQSVEVLVDGSAGGAVRVVGLVENPDTYPVSNKRHTFEYLREQAHLRVRTNTFGAVARVRHTLSMAMHRFFHERDFFYVHTPIVTASDCEGAGQMFRVSTLDMLNPPRVAGAGGKDTPGPIDYSQDFFGKEAHLTVSGQLNVETYCSALSRVYTFGPTFRAENSNTSRHLAEFWMIEPEIAFADLTDDARLAEDFIKHLIRAVLDERPDDMKFFEERIEKGLLARLGDVLEKPFLHLPYTEAIRILEKAIAAGQVFEYPVKWGSDLQSEHERFLTEQHFKQPVVLMNYPKQIKAFYMRVNDPGTDSAPGETVAAMDVLVPAVGEIIGGSQREERLEVLDARIEEMKLPAKEYWWYRDLRRYGTVPHAGFGLGFERAMMFLTGMQNVRDVIPFPRTPKSADF